MPESEKLLSFRQLEPEHVRSEPPASSQPDVGTHCVEMRRAVHGTVGDCCAVPWSGRPVAQPFAWHELRDDRPLRQVRILLGKATMSRGDVQPLSAGAIVVLDRATDDPVEICVDGRVVAIGRLVVARDNKLAVEIHRVRKAVRGQAA